MWFYISKPRIPWTENASNKEVLRKTDTKMVLVLTSKVGKVQISGIHHEERWLG